MVIYESNYWFESTFFNCIDKLVTSLSLFSYLLHTFDLFIVSAIYSQVELKTAPADFRFPTTNQTRHCFTRYVEFHRYILLLCSTDNLLAEFFFSFLFIFPLLLFQKATSIAGAWQQKVKSLVNVRNLRSIIVPSAPVNGWVVLAYCIAAID